ARRRGGGLARERGDQLIRARRLVDWHERVAVLDQLQSGIRELPRETLAVAQLEEAIFGRPGDQHRLGELAESLGGLQGVALGDPLEHRGYFAADLTVGERRRDPG